LLLYHDELSGQHLQTKARIGWHAPIAFIRVGMAAETNRLALTPQVPVDEMFK
jgi:hypothetical protein